jgi:hypothetical protein
MSLIEINYINFLDTIQQTYKKILVVNLLPNDSTFKSIIKTINSPRLSPFESHSSSNCIYAILNPQNKNKLLELSDIGLLFNFLSSNNFNLHTTFNETLKNNSKFICYVSK